MKTQYLVFLIALTVLMIGVSSCQQNTAIVEQNATKTCADLTPVSPDVQSACEARGGKMTSKTDANSCPMAPECVVPNEIIIKGNEFVPSELPVAKGSRVTWRNEDSVEHTVTFDQNQFYLINYKIQPGLEVSDYFNIAGTYTYHCLIHPSMKGTIIVK